MVRVDVDGSVEVAWRAFEHRLTADLVELGRGGELEIGVPTGRPGRSPLALRFRARPATILVSATGSPPRDGGGSLARRMPPTGVPKTKVFRIGAEPAIAAWATGVLREAYGVVHPAFLTAEHTAADGARVPRPSLVPTGLSTRRARVRAAAAAAGGSRIPASPDELDDLVKSTLETATSVPLVRDDDGDIPLGGEHGTVYVRVRRDCPVVEVFATVAVLDETEDVAAAVRAVNARNARSVVETYVVMGNLVVVRTSVLCNPYQGLLVVSAINTIMHVLQRAGAEGYSLQGADDDDESDVEDGGADADSVDEPAAAGELTTEMLTLLQLDAAEPGSVTPALAAQIFDHDRGRLLAGIREAEWEVISWRECIDEARERDEEEAVVCAGEMSAWQGTVDLLRAALRVTVER